MNHPSSPLSRVAVGAALIATAVLAAFGSTRAASANEVILYRTGFEASEGYDNRLTLVGQNGWIGYGTGGNGLVTNAFEGEGQQAFVGFAGPLDTNDMLNVWRPMASSTTGSPAQVQFSVWMAIVDSTNRYYDDFRWSVYNGNSNRLFTVDFDNYTLAVSYALDDSAGFISTGTLYTNNTLYLLSIDLDFANNTWSATLNDQPLVSAKPITTTGAARTLGDVDAVWAIREPGHPGNNYMLFDNYTLSIGGGSSSGPHLEAVGRLPDGSFVLHVRGQPARSYTIEASDDFVSWHAIKTVFTGSDGTADLVDASAAPFQQRFYRVRQ